MKAQGINEISGWLVVLTIGMFAGIAILSAAVSGIPYGNDLTQHYQFAATISEAISNGDLYPSLSPLANGGTGDYGLRFYPPLGYYLLAVCYKVAGGWFSGSLLAFFAIFFAGGSGVYLWAREAFTQKQSLIAAALFVLAPYHLNQIYNSFLYGEFAASAIVPFCFLYLHKVATRPTVASAAALSAVYALLILTHLPSLIFFSVAFAVYGLVVIWHSKNFVSGILASVIAVATSLAATAFYWIKPYTEMGWINHSKPEYFENVFSYTNHFLLRPSNILNYQSDSLTVWVGDLVLLATVFVCLPALLILVRKRFSMPPIIAGSLAVFVTGVFMASILSKPLWDIAPFLQKIQFPWRWVGVVAVSGSVLAAYGISAVVDKTEEGKGFLANAALAVAALVFTVSAVFITKQPAFSPSSNFTDEKVNAILTSASRDCWWTVWAKDGFYRFGDPRVMAEGRGVKVRRWDTLEKQAGFSPGPETDAVFAVQFYPHWHAIADDRRIETSPTEQGLLKVTVPKNVTSVTLRFREPDEVRAASIVSASAFGLVAFILVLSLARRSFRRDEDEEEQDRLNG